MLYDCRTVAERDWGIHAAIDGISRGDLVVLPTDTVYGIAADAFQALGGYRTAQRQGPGPAHAAAGAGGIPARRSMASSTSCPVRRAIWSRRSGQVR
jgi:hypothetical protein